MAPILVQSKIGLANATTNTLTVSMDGNFTSGNCIIAMIGLETSSVNITVGTVTVGGSNFTGIGQLGNAGTGGGHCEIWAFPNCPGGSSSVVITTSSSQPAEIIMAYIYEVSGLAATAGALVDKNIGTAQTSPSSTLSSGTTATTTQASEFWVGIADDSGTSSLTGPASPWTNLPTINAGNAFNYAVSGYRIVSSTGTAAYIATQSSGATGTAIVYALFAQTATNATITGAVANVTISPQAGLTAIAPAGAAAIVIAAAIAGAISIQGGYITSGETARVTVLAPGGTVSVLITAATASVPVTGPAGSSLLCRISVNPPVPAGVTFMSQRVSRKGKTLSHRRRGVPVAAPAGQHPVPVAMGQPPPQLTWDVRIPVTAVSRAIRWDVYRAVSRTALAAWNARQAVNANTALSRWNTGDPVSRTASIGWANLSRPGKPAYMYWITFHGSVTVLAQVAWNTGTGIVNVTGTAAWDTQRRVNPVRPITWDVGLVVINAQVLTTWNTRKPVNALSQASWNTNTAAVNVSTLTSWNLNQRVSVTAPAAWNALSSKVALKTAWWNTRVPVSSPVPVVAWTIRSPVNAPGFTVWDTRTRVSKTAALAWQVHDRSSRTVPAGWAALARVSPIPHAAWNVRTAVSTAEGIGYNCMVPVAKTRPAGWNAYRGASQQHQAAWKITPTLAAAALCTFHVKHTVSTAPAPVAWNIRLTVVQLTGLASWNVRAARSSYPALADWGVIFHVDPGAAIRWHIRSPVTVAATAIQWNIGQPQQGGMRLATMDEWFTPE